jgi:hypothetical protein
MTNKSVAASGKPLLLYQARLDGSTSAPQDVDRMVRADRAAEALLQAFRGTPGNRLPQRVIAYISTHVTAVCDAIVAGELAGVEVISAFHGCLALRGIYDPANRQGDLAFLTVSHSGRVYMSVSFASPYVTDRIEKAMEALRHA